METERDRQRQTERDRERQADRQTGRQTDRQADRQSGTDAHTSLALQPPNIDGADMYRAADNGGHPRVWSDPLHDKLLQDAQDERHENTRDTIIPCFEETSSRKPATYDVTKRTVHQQFRASIHDRESENKHPKKQRKN